MRRRPADITVAWMEATFEGVQVITPGFESATEALGWELVVINYDVADPQSMNTAIQQAVDQGVDYIAMSGQPTAVIESGLASHARGRDPVRPDGRGQRARRRRQGRADLHRL